MSGFYRIPATSLLMIAFLFFTGPLTPAYGLGSVGMTLSLSARAEYEEGTNAAQTLYGDPVNDNDVAAGDVFTISTAPINFNHSSDAGEGSVSVNGYAAAILQLDGNRKPSGKIIFSGEIVANARPNESPDYESTSASLRMEIMQGWSFLRTEDGVYSLDSRITSIGGTEQYSRFDERHNWLVWPQAHATNFNNRLDTQSQSFTYRNLWRAGDSTYPGASLDNPLRSEGGGKRPSNTTTLIKYDDDVAPPQAQAPNDIQGIRLTDSGTAGLATLSDSEESTFAMSLYGSPVVSGGYGEASLVYHRGSESTSTQALSEADGSQSAASTDPAYATGYFFLNNGGGNFTSFTIPDALPGGDSQFELNLDGLAYNLAAGDLFDFTTIDLAGVDSFVLLGIDESEMIDPQIDMPFTIGVTTVAGSDASFVAVPLVPVPEPSTLTLATLLLIGFRYRRRKRIGLSRNAYPTAEAA